MQTFAEGVGEQRWCNITQGLQAVPTNGRGMPGTHNLLYKRHCITLPSYVMHALLFTVDRWHCPRL